VKQLHLGAGPEFAVGDADEDDHALVGVEIAVEDEGLEGPDLGGHRRRNPVDDGFENFGDADAFLGAGENGVLARHRENVLQLLLGHRDVGVRQVDLVDDRDDREALLGGQVEVGDGLGLDALGSVDDHERSFAGAEAAGHFIGEVDVSGGVDQVQLVALAVLGVVIHRDRMGLDGDAALLFEIHPVEVLGLEVTVRNRAGVLEQSVGKRRLPVVDVGDDAEISDELRVHAVKLSPRRGPNYLARRVPANLRVAR
jgi:hypothetical protein